MYIKKLPTIVVEKGMIVLVGAAALDEKREEIVVHNKINLDKKICSWSCGRGTLRSFLGIFRSWAFLWKST